MSKILFVTFVPNKSTKSPLFTSNFGYFYVAYYTFFSQQDMWHRGWQESFPIYVDKELYPYDYIFLSIREASISK